MENSENSRLCEALEQDILRWEGQTLEFMEKFPDNARELAKEVAAFATSNAGTIYLGADDDGKVVGVEAVAGLQDIRGKDEFSRRIEGTARSVDPPIRVSINFIDKEGRVVVRVDVPKGSEPVYYVGGVPYLRDLTSSRQARAMEVKELYSRYFQATRPVPADVEQNFVIRLIDQLSDAQLLLFDYEDHLIRPDVNQMRYDLGVSGAMLLELSSEEPAKRLGIEERLPEISDCLAELGSHRFYLGRQFVDEFGEKAKACSSLVIPVFNQVRKHARAGSITDYVQLVRSSIDLLQKEWERRNRYFERGEIERLREAFRRFGFIFYRLGNYPEAESFVHAPENLRILGQKLRNLSSVQKYFIYGVGTNPVERIEPRFQECVELMNDISKEVQRTAANPKSSL
jgi:hypothetical protein